MTVNPHVAQWGLGALDSQQTDNIQTLLRVGYELGASYDSLWAAMLLGCGENSWRTYGCNSGGYCGVFQIGGAWQSQHPYTDVNYWAYHAYRSGFYGYGGLLGMPGRFPNESPGFWTNACQGAYVPALYYSSGSYYDHYYDYGQYLIKQFYDSAIRGTAPPPTGSNVDKHAGAVSLPNADIGLAPTVNVDPSPIIRKGFYTMALHGQRAYSNANYIRKVLSAIKYCDINGPN